MGKNIVFRKRGRAFVPEPGKFYAGERSNSETSTIRAVLWTECRGKLQNQEAGTGNFQKEKRRPPRRLKFRARSEYIVCTGVSVGKL